MKVVREGRELVEGVRIAVIVDEAVMLGVYPSGSTIRVTVEPEPGAALVEATTVTCSRPGLYRLELRHALGDAFDVEVVAFERAVLDAVPRHQRHGTSEPRTEAARRLPLHSIANHGSEQMLAGTLAALRTPDKFGNLPNLHHFGWD